MYWELVAGAGKLHKRIEDRLEAGKRSGSRKKLPGHTLYHFQLSPNARRVRKALLDLGIDMPMKDVLTDDRALDELVRGGGKDLVPCLRIESPEGTRWMYESRDIVKYLTEKAAP